MKNIIPAMQKYGIKRILAISAAQVEENPHPKGNFIWNRVLLPLAKLTGLGKNIFEDMARMEGALKDSDLEWTIIRPGGLFNHPDPTDYEVYDGSPARALTARADVAAFIMKELAEPQYIRKIAGVATKDVNPGFWTVLRDN